MASLRKGIASFAFVLAAAAASCTAAPRAARADSWTTTDEPARNYGNLRIGSSSADPEGHPSLCLEVSPLALVSFEGCGTGSGFLHHSTQPELAHFRSKWRVATLRTQRAWFQPQLAVGFAELQVGEDESGFDFSGTGKNGVETAGPEAGASLKMLVPMGSDFELVGDLGAGVAWMPHAPDLVRRSDEFQFSAGVTIGIGF